MDLIHVKKGSDIIAVHPTCLKAHSDAGWVIFDADERSIISLSGDGPEAILPLHRNVDGTLGVSITTTSDIRKGPRGMFYVHSEGQRVGNGYATADEALASVSN